MMAQSYDLLIIGGGSAGLSAAEFALQFDASVAIVEKDRIGGDCTWTGCVPSKTLLKVASVAHEMRTADQYGLLSMEPDVDIEKVMAHVRSVIEDIYAEESPQVLRQKGIDVYLGAARFLDDHTLAVGERELKAGNFLIATGARPLIPPIEGIESVDYLTYETIWALERLPEDLIVLGAGPVGAELAQAFRRLGAGVTLIEGLERVLPNEDPQASHLLARRFEGEGLNVHCAVMVERAWQDDEGIHLSAGEQAFVGDALLVATGRRPNVNGLELEKAGVDYSEAGISVDKFLHTSQRHIYAAGDCLGSFQFTHYAGWQAAMAARNALMPGASKGVADRVPRASFTDPAVAQAGLTEAQARDRFGEKVKTYLWPLDQIDRAHTDGDEAGFIKLVYKGNGNLLGVTVVARRAGEIIHEWILALERGIKIADLSDIIHVYPTYATANQEAAADIRVEQVLSGLSGRVLRGLARLMR